MLHTTRDLVREVLFKASQTDQLDVFASALLALDATDALNLQAEADVFENGPPRKQAVVLEDQTSIGARRAAGCPSIRTSP